MAASATDVIRLILSENPKKTIVDPSLTPAAVMLLLYPKDGEFCVLLNKRSDHVEHHKGEISFPGGRKDEADETLLHTALRETYEEMGIRPEDVEVLGEVDDMPTSSQFLISTTVATIPYPYLFKPNKQEIAAYTLTRRDADRRTLHSRRLFVGGDPFRLPGGALPQGY